MDLSHILLEYLVPTLGPYKRTYENFKFNCFICDAGNKYNLEIHAEHKTVHCWGCGYKGYITKLLRDKGKNDSWKQLSDFQYSSYTKTSFVKRQLHLPQSLVPFYFNKSVEKYLIEERSLNKQLLIERKVKYVYDENDRLYNHIVFPFYDINGEELEGFSVQNFGTKKYKNFGSRIFIPYIEFINPNYPITLTEGIYDCLSIPNSIPLLGTEISETILNYCSEKNIILAVDNQVSERKIEYMINQLKEYNTNLLYRFNTREYKDLNEMKQLNFSLLKDKYQMSVETIFANL